MFKNYKLSNRPSSINFVKNYLQSLNNYEERYTFLLSLHYLVCFIKHKLSNIPNNVNLIKTICKIIYYKKYFLIKFTLFCMFYKT